MVPSNHTNILLPANALCCVLTLHLCPCSSLPATVLLSHRSPPTWGWLSWFFQTSLRLRQQPSSELPGPPGWLGLPVGSPCTLVLSPVTAFITMYGNFCFHVCFLSPQSGFLPITGPSMGTHTELRSVKGMHFLFLLGHRSVGCPPPSSRGMIQR